MSVTSSPARRSAASSSGRESGLRPGASNASRTSADQRLEPLRPGAARRPRPEQVGEQALVDVDPPRHAGVRHLGRDEGTRRLRREQQPEPGGLGRCRHGGQLPGVLEVGAQVLGRVVDGEQGGSDGVLGPSRSQCSDCSPSSSCTSTAGARRSRWWPSRRSWQRSTRTPAASSGGYHRAVSSHTQRGESTSRSSRTPAGRPPPPHARASPSTTSTRSPGRRERDPGHEDTLTPRGDTETRTPRRSTPGRVV